MTTPAINIRDSLLVIYVGRRSASPFANHTASMPMGLTRMLLCQIGRQAFYKNNCMLIQNAFVDVTQDDICPLLLSQDKRQHKNSEDGSQAEQPMDLCYGPSTRASSGEPWLPLVQSNGANIAESDELISTVVFLLSA
ncbi:hypothetical protein AAHC03_05724 [Spirometra sp. Aus1]